MNKSRPVATETVKSLDYTKNILQTIPNNDTMEVVTQTNAVKSPTDSLKATTLVSAILTKTSRAKTATNGKVFPRKRRQQIAKNKSNMNWQTELF